MNQAQIIFAVFAAIAAVSAVLVVALDNPVRSALALVANFFTLAFLYFSLQAHLLGITQILVYTGAIMVLFLFVIMLLNLGAPQALREQKDRKPLPAICLGIALFLAVFIQVIWPLQYAGEPRAPANFGTPESIGKTLFTGYVWPFEIASLLLLVGIVGSILLAKRRI